MLTAGAGAGLWIAGGVVAAGAAAAAAGMFGGENPQALVRTGMQKFRKVRDGGVPFLRMQEQRRKGPEGGNLRPETAPVDGSQPTTARRAFVQHRHQHTGPASHHG